MNAPIDISQVVLKTERLCLRPWTPDDLADFYAYASADGVGQMAGWLPHKDIEESRMILQHFIDGKKTFALEYQGKVIGSLGIERYDEDYFSELAMKKGREIGYVLAKDDWGQGLMPEAVQAVVDYLFHVQNLDFLMIGYFMYNHQSGRVAEKCGFKPYRRKMHKTHFGNNEETQMTILYNQPKQ